MKLFCYKKMNFNFNLIELDIIEFGDDPVVTEPMDVFNIMLEKYDTYLDLKNNGEIIVFPFDFYD